MAEVKDSPLRDFDRVNFGPYTFVQEDCPSIKTSTPSAWVQATPVIAIHIHFM